MKIFKFIISKVKNREFIKYILWKFGIQQFIRHQILSNPIKYAKCLYYRYLISNSDSKKEDLLNLQFNYLKNKKSDIFMHLETLYRYSMECNSVLETGVRGVVSSWAFLKGINESKKSPKKLFLNDIQECDIELLIEVSNNLGIEINWKWENNLNLVLDSTYDLVFIDTLHVYGQLKRELNKFSKICNKYIILHDTTIDGIDGEIIRRNMNPKKYSEQLDIPEDELTQGLLKAVNEFLELNTNWILNEKFEYNNGLTILKTIN